MTAFQMFKSAKVKRLERELEAVTEAQNMLREWTDKLYTDLADMTYDCERMTCALTDMTEARDAVAAASKFLRDKCDMQDAVLKMIAVYGEKHPECCVRIAKAAVESE